jgi:hypothetical protein
MSFLLRLAGVGEILPVLLQDSDPADLEAKVAG